MPKSVWKLSDEKIVEIIEIKTRNPNIKHEELCQLVEINISPETVKTLMRCGSLENYNKYKEKVKLAERERAKKRKECKAKEQNHEPQNEDHYNELTGDSKNNETQIEKQLQQIFFGENVEETTEKEAEIINETNGNDLHALLKAFLTVPGSGTYPDQTIGSKMNDLAKAIACTKKEVKTEIANQKSSISKNFTVLYESIDMSSKTVCKAIDELKEEVAKNTMIAQKNMFVLQQAIELMNKLVQLWEPTQMCADI